jgi:opacity protein-like surface antigen
MFDAGSPRVYASAIIGPSFGQLGTTVGPSLTSSDTIITGGGALGIAFERPMGQLRLEVEGMGRGTYDAGIDGLPPGFLSLHVTNNWSAMTNMWRDLMLSDSFGVYGGGGIGAGGYLLGVDVLGNRLYLDPATAFAWQAGGGVIWNITDRLTFDAGYRFYQIDSVQQAPMVTPNQFQSNEVMFTLRLYEPFRGIWR